MAHRSHAFLRGWYANVQQHGLSNMVRRSGRAQQRANEEHKFQAQNRYPFDFLPEPMGLESENMFDASNRSNCLDEFAAFDLDEVLDEVCKTTTTFPTNSAEVEDSTTHPEIPSRPRQVSRCLSEFDRPRQISLGNEFDRPRQISLGLSEYDFACLFEEERLPGIDKNSTEEESPTTHSAIPPRPREMSRGLTDDLALLFEQDNFPYFDKERFPDNEPDSAMDVPTSAMKHCKLSPVNAEVGSDSLDQPGVVSRSPSKTVQKARGMQKVKASANPRQRKKRPFKNVREKRRRAEIKSKYAELYELCQSNAEARGLLIPISGAKKTKKTPQKMNILCDVVKTMEVMNKELEELRARNKRLKCSQFEV